MAATEFTPIFLVLAITLILVKMIHPVMKKLNLPEVLGEIFIGILIGPSLIGLVILDSTTASKSLLETLLFLDHETVVLINNIMLFIAETAVLLLLFEVGLEMDIASLKKSGKGAIYSALGGVIIPFITGIFLILIIGSVVSGSEFIPKGVPIQDVALFFGATLTATSIGISVRIFMELGKLNSTAAKIMIGAAVIDDILAILLLSFAVVYFEEETALGANQITQVAIIFVSIIVFFLFIYILYKLFPRIISYIQSINDRYLPLVFALILIFFLSWFASFMSLAPIIGAFVAGLLINPFKEYTERIMEHLPSLSHWVVPIFFIAVGLRVDLRILAPNGIINILLIGISLFVIVFAVLAKIIGSGIGAFLGKTSANDSLTVGLSMSARGEVVLIFASFALDIGIFTTFLFSSLVLLVIITSIFVPITLKLFFLHTDKNIEAQKT